MNRAHLDVNAAIDLLNQMVVLPNPDEPEARVDRSIDHNNNSDDTLVAPEDISDERGALYPRLNDVSINYIVIRV